MSCVAKKRTYAAPARDLYTSALFQKARAYAEGTADAWFVLSAKYGLVNPDTVIEPYDVTLNEMGVGERRVWVAKVQQQLELVTRTGDTIVMLAGAHYREGLTAALQRRGVRVEVPMQGLKIGEQLQWLSRWASSGGRAEVSNGPQQRPRPRVRVREGPRQPAPASERRESVDHSALDDFYALVTAMADRYGIVPLGACTAAMNWPERGVYFFLDPQERRANDAKALRIVRVGTHALNAGSQSTMWKRLHQHRGQASGMGNHRVSVFRQHVGLALLARDGLTHPTWGVRPSTGRHEVEAERELEERVSAYLARLPVVHVPVLDEPGPETLRGYVTRNAIALLSTRGAAVDTPSEGWLGRHAKARAIRRSGLWNVKHVGKEVEEGFLGALEGLVLRRSGSRPA